MPLPAWLIGALVSGGMSAAKNIMTPQNEFIEHQPASPGMAPMHITAPGPKKNPIIADIVQGAVMGAITPGGSAVKPGETAMEEAVGGFVSENLPQSFAAKGLNPMDQAMRSAGAGLNQRPEWMKYLMGGK